MIKFYAVQIMQETYQFYSNLLTRMVSVEPMAAG